MKKSKPLRLIIRVVSYLAFVYATLGYLNQTYFHWVNSFWLSNYSEKIAIIAFGVWRVFDEKNPYTRKRLAVLTTLIASLWLLFPYITKSSFFNHHLIGTTWFFSYLLIIFLFGRRADCSWNCPCVGIRDTVGDAFRSNTIKGDLAWKLRRLRWLFLASIVIAVFLILVVPRTHFTRQYTYYFYQVNTGLYFASLFLVPWIGNRNYCRYLCPWGALYGAISKLGFYRIAANKDLCTRCGLCEKNCDMGIPIRQLVQQYGQIKVADCTGCGRCVSSCPRHALKFVDVRDSIYPLLGQVRELITHQNRSEKI